MNKRFLIPKINKHIALPAANQLARQLTWLIADGAITEGEKLPTIREYAEVLGIHHHTVRAAYHLLEEQNIVSIQPRVGTVVQKYVPFQAGAQLDYLDSEMVAILVPSISDFYKQVIAGIEDVALDSRLLPFILSCHEDPYYAEILYRNLSARGIRGIINISIGFSDEFYLNFKREDNLNVPLVFLDVVDSGTHSLTIDSADAIRLATEHLLEHGHEEIALINAPVDWPVGREALSGFRRALQGRGRPIKDEDVITVPDFSSNAGRFVITRILRENVLPQAIVTVSDTLAIGAVSELKEQGLRVPEDVAVIGFNDIAAASVVEPRLTTIGLPLFEMGQQTMLTLNKVLEGKNQNWIHKEFSGKLVIRESCGCTALQNSKGEYS